MIDRLTRRFGAWPMAAMSTPRAVNTRAVRITAHTGHSAPLLAWQLWPLLLGQFGQQYGGTATQAWQPALDISERKDAYLVSVELPGIGMDEIEITFEGSLLTIQGERHLVHDSSEQKMHRVERRYGAFRRSINLPTHVMADAIEATVQDGVLYILVPKATEVHAKRIAVSAGPGGAQTKSTKGKTRT